MIYHDVAPRSKEWFAVRLGIPTSSEFHKIITPKTLKVSSQAPAYMHRLLAEWVTGQQVENWQGDWMERGVELEDEAVAAYELLTGLETERGGFITTDDGMLGCSPDRLIGTVGDLELKSPLIQTQIGYALDGLSDEYRCQVQGRLLIHEREWVDLFSYHPLFSIPPVRITRDEKFIAILRPVLDQFVQTMLACRLELEQRFGPFTRPEPEQAKEASDWLGVSQADLDAILSDGGLKQ